MTISQLVDQFGRPFKARDQARPVTRTVAAAVLRDRWSDYPAAGLTPEKLAGILRRADLGEVAAQAELFDRIECDPHIGSVLGTRKNAVLGLELGFSPASESSEDKRICAFVEEQIRGLSGFDETLLDLLDAIGKGYSLVEIGWKLVSGRAEIGALRRIPPQRATWTRLESDPWAFDDRTPRLLTRENEIEGVEIPPFKVIYHRYKARSGYDTGAGVLRVVCWMYLFKNYGLKDWMTFSEIFGMPLRLGKYGANASEDDREALYRAVTSLGADSAGIISESTEIEFVHALKAGGEAPYRTLCDWCDRQISKAILGQTLTTETDGKGSYAAGRVHNEVRLDLLRADAHALARTLRDQLVRPLVGFNFGWDKPLPEVELPVEEAEDLKNLAEVFGILAEKLNYPFTLEQVAERFKLRTPKEGETRLRPAAPGPADDGLGALRLGIPLKEGFVTPAAGDPVELVHGRLRETAAPLADGWIDHIRALLDEVSTLEEFRDRLLDVFGDLDPADLGEVMAEAMTLAELAGRFDVARGN